MNYFCFLQVGTGYWLKVYASSLLDYDEFWKCLIDPIRGCLINMVCSFIYLARTSRFA